MDSRLSLHKIVCLAALSNASPDEFTFLCKSVLTPRFNVFQLCGIIENILD